MKCNCLSRPIGLRLLNSVGGRLPTLDRNGLHIRGCISKYLGRHFSLYVLLISLGSILSPHFSPMARTSHRELKHGGYPRAFIYWVELRYRNAATQWKWATKKFRKSRPSPINERPVKKIPTEKKRAHEAWLLTQHYIEETLQQTVGEYLHH